MTRRRIIRRRGREIVITGTAPAGASAATLVTAAVDALHDTAEKLAAPSGGAA